LETRLSVLEKKVANVNKRIEDETAAAKKKAGKATVPIP
jgi:hypothetical protein